MGFDIDERLEVERALDRHIRFLKEELEFVRKKSAELTEPGKPPKFMYVESDILERIGNASSALQKLK